MNWEVSEGLTCTEQFFDEAKYKLMKDLVDFNQREDFEFYMRGLEKHYFE